MKALLAVALFLLAQTQASFSILVTAPSGVPLKGATVTLSSASGTFTATTDDNGRALLTALPAGTYTVVIRAPGFETYRIQGVALAAGGPQPVSAVLHAITKVVPQHSPPPTTPASPDVRDAIIAAYNAGHPEHSKGTPYFGRYTYVVLRGSSSSNEALLAALIASYAPGGSVTLGPVRGLDNPFGYNLFLIPVASNVSVMPQNLATGTAAKKLLQLYDWVAARNIRDRYCGVRAHARRSVCKMPYDAGPILLTFLRPLQGLKPKDPLPPALAYDLSGVPETEMAHTMARLAQAVEVPAPIANDQLLPPPFASRYIAPFLSTITAALEKAVPAMKVFSDAGMISNH